MSDKESKTRRSNFTQKLHRGPREVGKFLLLIIYGIYSYLHLIFRQIFPPSMKSLDGEVFLITGSSSGIGRAVVLQLAKNHPKTTLVLWDCNGELNKKTAEKARESGTKVYCYEVDVTDKDQVKETAKKVQAEVGSVTILFNNAGIAAGGYFFKSSDADLERTVQVNLISHFWTLRAFMPKMIENNHGHIVTTASLGSYFGHKLCLPYYAAKFGIRGYLESLQDELNSHPSNPDQIKFTTIFPGFVETPMTANVKTTIGIKKTNNYLKADFVAKKIIDGVRQDQEKVIIPRVAEIVIFAKSVMPKRFFMKIQNYLVTKRDK